jgi:hypothetical protein
MRGRIRPFASPASRAAIEPCCDRVWPYSLDVEVIQAAALTRDPSITVLLATTWSVSAFGYTSKPNVRNLREDIKDEVDKFINAYLAVNP